MSVQLNTFFLIASLRSVYKVTKEKATKTGNKRNLQLFWSDVLFHKYYGVFISFFLCTGKCFSQ